MGFIQKFILPESVDFVSALREQASLTRVIVSDLHVACANEQPELFASIRSEADRALALKNTNMKKLLNVFLTPYDKESIYRLITQLDWVVMSVKHFVIEREVYGIESLSDYMNIFVLLKEMAELLEQGSRQLGAKELTALASTSDQIHDKYDQVVESCAMAIAALFESDDCKTILRHRDILAQLREIAKRIHIAANNLADMAIKTA